jgi:hypothetical protein
MLVALKAFFKTPLAYTIGTIWCLITVYYLNTYLLGAQILPLIFANPNVSVATNHIANVAVWGVIEFSFLCLLITCAMMVHESIARVQDELQKFDHGDLNK